MHVEGTAVAHHRFVYVRKRPPALACTDECAPAHNKRLSHEQVTAVPAELCALQLVVWPRTHCHVAATVGSLCMLYLISVLLQHPQQQAEAC